MLGRDFLRLGGEPGILMPSFHFKTLFAAVVVVLAGIAGCAGDSVGSRDQGSIAKSNSAPAAPPAAAGELKPRKANLPDLPEGAGPMDADAPDEFVPTRSGLYYRILRKSNGRKPRSTDKVLAHYKGWLDNGQKFDSSYEHGEPTEFALNAVVPGWTEGLQLIGEGGMIELEVPPRLGYGAHGNAGVPPNSRLHFIVELKKIE